MLPVDSSTIADDFAGKLVILNSTLSLVSVLNIICPYCKSLFDVFFTINASILLGLYHDQLPTNFPNFEF